MGFTGSPGILLRGGGILCLLLTLPLLASAGNNDHWKNTHPDQRPAFATGTANAVIFQGGTGWTHNGEGYNKKNAAAGTWDKPGPYVAECNGNRAIEHQKGPGSCVMYENVMNSMGTESDGWVSFDNTNNKIDALQFPHGGTILMKARTNQQDQWNDMWNTNKLPLQVKFKLTAESGETLESTMNIVTGGLNDDKPYLNQGPGSESYHYSPHDSATMYYFDIPASATEFSTLTLMKTAAEVGDGDMLQITLLRIYQSMPNGNFRGAESTRAPTVCSCDKSAYGKNAPKFPGLYSSMQEFCGCPVGDSQDNKYPALQPGDVGSMMWKGDTEYTEADMELPGWAHGGNLLLSNNPAFASHGGYWFAQNGVLKEMWQGSKGGGIQNLHLLHNFAEGQPYNKWQYGLTDTAEDLFDLAPHDGFGEIASYISTTVTNLEPGFAYAVSYRTRQRGYPALNNDFKPEFEITTTDGNGVETTLTSGEYETTEEMQQEFVFYPTTATMQFKFALMKSTDTDSGDNKQPPTATGYDKAGLPDENGDRPSGSDKPWADMREDGLWLGHISYMKLGLCVDTDGNGNNGGNPFCDASDEAVSACAAGGEKTCAPSPVDCAGSWSGCTSACEAAADRTWVETTAMANEGEACPAAGTGPDCANNDGACQKVDCAGTWSTCGTACEAAADRTWTETAAKEGPGADCPTAEDCGDGDGTCVSTDCAGTWSECSESCEVAADRTWTETTAKAGLGADCPAAGSGPNCGVGDGNCTSIGLQGQSSQTSVAMFFSVAAMLLASTIVSLFTAP